MTVGHIRHLEDEDCDPVRNPGELATAVRICSMPARKWWAWKDARTTPLVLSVWAKLLGTWDFVEKLELWAEYVRWHTEMPVMKFRGSGRESALPSYRFTRVKLLRLGYSPRDIDDTPYLDALWDITAAMEMDGSGESLGCTETELDEYCEATDFDAMAKQAAERLAEKLRVN